jgi:hypothetical protein
MQSYREAYMDPSGKVHPGEAVPARAHIRAVLARQAIITGLLVRDVIAILMSRGLPTLTASAGRHRSRPNTGDGRGVAAG